MSLLSLLRRSFAAAALAAVSVGAAQAHTLFGTTATGNQIINVPGPVLVSGMVSPFISIAPGQRLLVHFAAECAVNAPAGNTTAWTDVDIVMLNAAGAVVRSLVPMGGNLGAFCSADGSAGLSGWRSNKVIAELRTNLPLGRYRVQVRARLNNGATQASYGERTLLITN
ncbi:MAG: hypothetical protein KIT35_17965 [Piscinibacter sp.]|uniref:hypothetical protein n=1 Tax=Piscinibacter TaxID=1114981 RepID=UPI000FDF1953|nr:MULTISPECIES: hypothetical protein [Piscinibacter]MCW5665719.1 hypothetical protein [Piscinibacter sp.]